MAMLVVAPACTGGDDGGAQAVRDLSTLAGPPWVPIAIDGRWIDNAGSYWVFESSRDEPGAFTITGNQSCNQFGLEGVPALDGNSLVGVSAWTTAAGCAFFDASVLPVDGMRLWLDENQLVVIGTWTPDGSEQEVRFVRAVERPTVPRAPPPTIDPSIAANEAQAARQAQIDAQAARRPAIRTALDAARQQWAAVGWRSYTLSFEAVCLDCPSFPLDPTSDIPLTVDVLDGAANSAWNAASVGATVDTWFAYLDAHLDSAWSMEVTFDATTGHPTSMSVTTREYADAANPEPFESFVIRGVVVTPATGG